MHIIVRAVQHRKGKLNMFRNMFAKERNGYQFSSKMVVF